MPLIPDRVWRTIEEARRNPNRRGRVPPPCETDPGRIATDRRDVPPVTFLQQGGATKDARRELVRPGVQSCLPMGAKRT